ncbi:MAG: trypsin-like peptidase domain-containing protein [candidate division Zixibacteria bacterium]|nr:trypsin-like peptidase domain-containing protein [candidate division Zixibacteria bacterium]
MKLLASLAVAGLLSLSAPFVSGQSQQQSLIYQARDRVLPALVHIQPVVKDYNTGELKKQSVVGSGVIFHPDGYVVTNYHVAGKAERIICTLGDKEQVTAKYIGGDPPTDLAVLKLDLTEYKGKLTVAEFGNSDSVQVGQYVLAMGSPLSLSRTVSAGVVSTKDRYFSSEVRLPTGEQTGNYNLWIQTDAAINPGNSGGPLVDLNGRVIGINSRATFFANNIGFAIPVNIVKEVTKAIMTEGKVVRSWIGIHAQALQELEGYFGTDGTAGVLVASIDGGSPASQAGLQAGDIIQSMDGNAVSARFVEELPRFYREIASRAPGSAIMMSVKRGNEVADLTVTTKLLGDLMGDDFESQKWGFTVKGITRQMQIENQLKDTLGVYVIGVKRSGPADEGGLRSGDVIANINREPVGSLVEFTKMYTSLSETKVDKILLNIKRGGSNRLVVVKPSEKNVMEQDSTATEAPIFHE